MFLSKIINIKLLISLAIFGIAFAAWQVFFAPKSFTVNAQSAPKALAAGELECFLKIDGIKGESQDRVHKDEIELESFSWGATNTGSSSSGGGGGAGKVQFQDFAFKTQFSSASPEIFLGVAAGKHYKDGAMTCRKAGKEQQDYLKWTFKDIIISSYKTAGEDSPVPTDSFSLNFGQVEVEYRPQKADGSLDAPIKAGWDLKSNTKL